MTDEEILRVWQELNNKGFVVGMRDDFRITFARRIAEIERKECAKEAEHWQLISTPEHKCGDYIAAAIRARGEK